MALVPPSNQPGASLGESGGQGENYRTQSSIPLIPGGPQGVIYARVGTLVVDDSGNVWVKSTDHTVNTGWKKPTLS